MRYRSLVSAMQPAMGRFCVAVFFILYLHFAEALEFPSAYYAKGNIILPYGGISEPFEAWIDRESGKSRLDTYDGEFCYLVFGGRY